MANDQEIQERTAKGWRTVPGMRKLGLFEQAPDGLIPRSLPQTRIGVYLTMFVTLGWLVVLTCIAIPVLYVCFVVLKAVLGF